MTPKRTRAGLEQSTGSKEQAAYLYGYVDPMCGSRGPMSSEHPTVMATLSSMSTIQMLSPSAAPPSMTGSGGVIPDNDIHLNGAVGAGTGDIVVACGPTYFLDKRVASAAQRFAPGFVCSTTRNPSKVAVNVTAGETSVQPFGAYTAAYPGPIEYSILDGRNALADGVTSQAFRVNGLRATVTVNSNVLTAVGQVYVSDNASYYPDFPAFNYEQVPGNGFVYNDPILEDADIYKEPLGNGSNTNRSVVSGPFAYASVHEGNYMPTNDNVTRYRNRFSSISRDTANDGYTLASVLMNSPYVLFHLFGIPADSTITIATTVSFEIPVRLGPDSTVGFLIAEARYSHKYVVDWSLLTPVPVGGPAGSGVLAYATTSVGRKGLSMAVSATPEPVYERNTQLGLTAPSATSVAVNMSNSHGSSVPIQQRLTQASGSTSSPMDWMVSRSNSLKSGAQKSHEIVNNVAEAGGQLYGLYRGFKGAYGYLSNRLGTFEREAEMVAERATPYVEEIAMDVLPEALMIAAKKTKNRPMNQMSKRKAKILKRQLRNGITPK